MQSLRAAEKSQEKVEAKGTGFSAEFFDSQSVEIFCFSRKISNVDNFLPELDIFQALFSSIVTTLSYI